MDKTTFPVLVVPDVKIDSDAMLMDPVNIHIGEDIRNPDLIISNIIDHLKQKEVDASWLFTVKEFTHDEKVKWIFSLPDPDSMLLTEVSFIFPVTVYNTLMLKVAETVGGEMLYEKKEVEKTIEKCIPA